MYKGNEFIILHFIGYNLGILPSPWTSSLLFLPFILFHATKFVLLHSFSLCCNSVMSILSSFKKWTFYFALQLKSTLESNKFDSHFWDVGFKTAWLQWKSLTMPNEMGSKGKQDLLQYSPNLSVSVQLSHLLPSPLFLPGIKPKASSIQMQTTIAMRFSFSPQNTLSLYICFRIYFNKHM